jgi:hypothetical protein
VTAVTICDTDHFIVEDEDRILDGTFAVLGKVASAVHYDVPILARNELLERIRPEAVDRAFHELCESVTKGAQELERRATTGPSDMEDVIDLALSSRVSGPSFQAIPIAIYI